MERFADRLVMMENKELGDLMRIIGRDDLISFAGGVPSPDIFPVRQLNEITAEIMAKKAEEFYQYSSTEGNNLLREYLAEFLARRGLTADYDNLIITTGSQQALDLVAKIFLNPGDKIVVEQPGYVGGIGAFKSYQADIKGIQMEADGINTVELEEYLEKLKNKGEYIKFIYLVPDYSNPSGGRLSLAKREKIVRLAEKYDFYILEDTPYSELNYYGERLDYIKCFDREDRVILLGTFSKFFVPGFRIAWVCSTKKIIKLLSRAKQNADLASNTSGQLILLEAGRQGLVEKQAELVKAFYRKRLEAMLSALDRFFPASTEWFKPEGGFFFWVRLPEVIKSNQLLQKAVARKVAFVTGSAFFVDPAEGLQYIRLSFSDSKVDEIEEGIKILGNLISDKV